MQPEAIITAYSAITRRIFAQKRPAIPVVIPARNEERDIPSCLVAMARSALPVQPIVVVNCTSDQTLARATAMGAIVVEINGVKKMGATQLGIQTALKRANWPDPAAPVILFTDADTLVPRNWSRHMADKLMRSLRQDPRHGAAIYGSSIYMHGPSKLADLAQCLHALALDIGYWLVHKPPLIRGHNYGLGLDNRGVIVKTIQSLDPVVMYRDDVLIAHSLRAHHVRILGTLRPSTMVWTRGDRAHSFTEFWRNMYKPNYEKSTYDKQYDIEACPSNKPTKQQPDQPSKTAKSGEHHTK